VLFAVPYAAKLLLQELMCLNIKVSLYDGITEQSSFVSQSSKLNQQPN
jgi:hypothetical protein